MGPDDLLRFMSKVERDPVSGCWLWQASTDHEGYGWFGIDGGVTRAHRASYEHFTGPIPDAHHIDHLCKVHGCVNPGHLEAVTQRENTLRGSGFAAQAAAKTHCKHGHPFTPENTYIHPKRGTRHCRACGRATQQRLAQRKRAS